MIDLLSSLPGAVAQGLIWGIMAVGVYITYTLLDIADLTVDGSICTGAAVCTMMLLSGRSLWLAVLCAVAAGLLAGIVTGLLHIWLGIPPILAGILTQMTLWSVNLKIMGKAPVRWWCWPLPPCCWWRCCTCSSARSWAAASGPPAATPS